MKLQYKNFFENILKEDWQVNAFNAIDKISQAKEIKDLLKLFLMKPNEFQRKIKREDDSVQGVVKSYIDSLKLKKASKEYK